MFANAHADLLVLESEIDERDYTLSCPFTFTMGVSKVKVPAGCVFFGKNDVNFKDQKEMSTPAVYFCTKSVVPLQIREDDMLKLGLDGSITTITPGVSSTVNFYSGDLFKGNHAEFTSETHRPLEQWLYHDKHNANDNVKSAVLTTTTENIPESCDEIGGLHKEEMQLNTELLVGKYTGGHFFVNEKTKAMKLTSGFSHQHAKGSFQKKAEPPKPHHSVDEKESMKKHKDEERRKSKSKYESWMHSSH